MTSTTYLINDTFKILIDTNEIIANENAPEAVRTKVEPQTMKVLKLLIEARGNIVSRKHLLKHIWNNYDGGEEGINQAISKLRKIMGDDARNSEIIETISKRGYRIIAGIDQLPTVKAPGPGEMYIEQDIPPRMKIVQLIEYLKKPVHLITFIVISTVCILALYFIYKIIYAMVWS